MRSKDHEIHSLQNKVTSLSRDLDNKNKVSKVKHLLFFTNEQLSLVLVPSLGLCSYQVLHCIKSIVHVYIYLM